ncbi:MAG TPA: hypothetical protein VHO46_01325 [Bacteroidales bacterium]|nr:hypothetical protein [Bacteroidales bacterium]
MGKNTTSVDSERIKGVDNGKPDSSAELSAKNPIIERLTTGRYRLYYDYIEWLGLSDESNIIVLSPNNHYYYDDEEMKDVRVVLNLKHLNHIKEVKGFLYTVNHALARSSYMVGSFIDRRHQYGFFSNSTYPDGNLQEGIDPVENGISSRIPLLNMIYDFIDSRTNNRNMTSKSVRLLLEITGFKVLDMTEINGITCFCAQKVTPS